jgi:putative ABC transport system permease protein
MARLSLKESRLGASLMREFFVLVFKNLGRNRLRTGLTLIAVLALTMIYSVVRTTSYAISEMVRVDGSENRLVVRERWMFPSRFPRRYLQQIGGMKGVDDWTVWNHFGGSWDGSNRSDRMTLGMATRIDNLRAITPGLEHVDQRAIDALERERTGAIVGPKLLKLMALKVGDRFEISSRSHPGKDLSFKIVGELPDCQWSSSFFFRDDYYQDGTGDRDGVGLMWLRVANPEVGTKLAAEIERRFNHSQEQLRVETESAGVERLASRTSDIVMIINLVVTILMVDMIIILANSISITTRERRKEMAILKVLGFQAGFIRSLVIGESMLVGFIGGGVGATLTYLVSWLNSHELLPFDIPFLVMFPVPPVFIPYGFLLGATVGFLGSVVPAWNAPKVKVVDVFSKVS